ncbi:helix-turn-helix domain-containing protein [Paenibacillus mesophilus]|uniref:AraC family transcriptional regulator n=1 Tax=Paenibacillus mesophilus TaxID=2582849 RepID=UPI00110F19DB|nr:helix-turn-helix domain-containing protein [Paenibacillus mesophilus]TMV46131.1 helix-turn-helix domain-containing protein [Paenibacillus mesophilus]
MKSVYEQIAASPLVPYIRQADFAVRYPYKYGERRLLDYLLIYVQEGNFHLYVEGKEYRLRDGDFCLVQPGDLHWFEGTTNTITPFAHLDLFYNPRRSESFPTRPGQVALDEYAHLLQPKLNDFNDVDVPVQFYPADSAHFRDAFLKAIALWMEQTPMGQLEAQQLATEAVLMLLRSYGKGGTASAGTGQLNWVTSYCSLRLSERLTVEQLARQAKLSPSRFTALFRQTFGQSPYQYVLRMRVQHARDLLAGSTMTLPQISELCGFTDIHHFSKAFKKSTGITPGSYRREHEGASK